LCASLRRQSASTHISNGRSSTPYHWASDFSRADVDHPANFPPSLPSLHLRQDPTTGPGVSTHGQPSGSRDTGGMHLPSQAERRSEQSCTAFRLPSYQN
jgi:hypothetical protein